MFKSTLVQLIQTLDRKEMTRFVEFVESPFFNKHKDVKRLVAYLNKMYPDLNKKKTEREFVYKQLFKGSKYDESKLKHVFSYTLRLLEKYLSLQEFLKVETDLQLYLLRDLRQRNQNKRFEKLLSKTKKTINIDEYQNFEHHFRMYSTISEADKYFIGQSTYKRDENLQLKVNSLDRFYLSEKLRSICEMINRRGFFNIEYDVYLVDEIMSFLKARPEWWSSTPSIQIYYQVYHTLTEMGNDEHIYELLRLIKEFGELFPSNERQDLYFYCLNYCIRRGNQGANEFWMETLEIYRELLRTDLLLDNGVLNESHYRNISGAALRVNENEWAKAFLEEYKDKLPATASENAYNYNLSRYYYHSKQYDEALLLLNTIEYTDLVYYTDSKSLLLRIYYELGESEALRSLIDSFKQYLTRNKTLNKTKIKRYSDHFRLAGRLYKLKVNFEYMPKSQWVKDVEKLERKVEETKALPGKGWIRQKLAELREMGGMAEATY